MNLYDRIITALRYPKEVRLAAWVVIHLKTSKGDDNVNKTIIITIIVDNVDLKDLPQISETLEKVFEPWKEKRIDIRLQDERLLRSTPPT